MSNEEICPDTAKDGGRSVKEIPSVEFDHASLTYKGASGESLTDITFCAMRGQTIGIIGGTGSGKSSLVNLIPRFYDVTTARSGFLEMISGTIRSRACGPYRCGPAESSPF